MTSLLQTFTQDISERVSKISKTSENNLSTDNDIFKNNYVFIVIIVFIGIFVLFFAFFVTTYIYFKCYRKSSNDRAIRENDRQAQYKSLDFESMVSDATVQQVNLERGRRVSESAYLSPVFVRNESYVEPQCARENETRPAKNEILRMDIFNRHDICLQTTNGESNVTPSPEDQIEHVYIEITEHELEPTNLTTVGNCANKLIDSSND